MGRTFSGRGDGVGAALRTAAFGAAALFVGSAPVRAQIGSDWSIAYEAPGATDGDCFTDALATLSDGRVVASVRVAGTNQARFLQYSPTGSLLWSKPMFPSMRGVFGTTLVDAAEDLYFVGLGGTLPNSGIRVVSATASGTPRWEQVVPTSSLDLTRAKDCAAWVEGGLWVLASEFPNGPLVWAGFDTTGAPRFTHTVELDPLAAEQAVAVASAGTHLVVAGSVGSNAVLAALDSNGSVLWRHDSSGAQGAGARYDTLAASGTQQFAAVGVANSTSGQHVLVDVRGPDGAALWSAQHDLGSSASTQATAACFASDGALWVAGSRLVPSSTRAFALRFPPGGGVPQQLEWLDGSGAVTGATTLDAGKAGQVWMGTSYFTAPPFGAERAAILMLSHAMDRVDLVLGNGIDIRALRTSALWEGARLYLGGRSDASPQQGLFFDPLAWVASVNVRATPDGYCVAQTSFAGCTPDLVFTGLPSSVASSGFVVSVSDVAPQVAGLFLYSANGAANTPFLGGTLCVQGPLKRSVLLSSGGAANSACSGRLELDFNAFARGALGGNPALELSQPGSTLHVQGYTRDSQAAGGANLSSGLRFAILP